MGHINVPTSYDVYVGGLKLASKENISATGFLRSAVGTFIRRFVLLSLSPSFFLSVEKSEAR